MGGIFAFLGAISYVLLATNEPRYYFPRSGQPFYLNSISFIARELGGGPPTYDPGTACTPTLDVGRNIQVQVNPALSEFYQNNTAHPEFNKEGKNWVLVKENVPIPAWKVILRQYDIIRKNGVDIRFRGGEIFHEMERIGTVLGGTPGVNDVYIGIGWCDPKTGQPVLPDRPFATIGCLDPLVQDVVFVLKRKGASTDAELVADPWLNNSDWGRDPSPNPPKTPDNLLKYYWEFDVYYDVSKFTTPNPTVNDLPAWMQLQCINGTDPAVPQRCWPDHSCRNSCVQYAPCRDTCRQDQNCVDLCKNDPQCAPFIASSGDPPPILAQVQASFANEVRLIIAKSEFENFNPSAVPAGITIEDQYVSVGTITSVNPATDNIIAEAYQAHFYVRLRQGTVAGSTSNHILILDPSIIGKPGPYYIFAPIVSVANPNNQSLQLGTFIPELPKFTTIPASLAYEWWTPSCKPALYLYPEEETELTVKVEPAGHITESIPDHEEEGWNVVAYPDGRIQPINRSTDQPINRTSDQLANSEQRTANYDYLYYEASLTNVTIPKDHGWIKSADALPVFFADILPHLGLNKTETRDFMDYWIPKLTGEGEQWYITLIDRKELDRVEKISFSKQPDTFIRVRFYFEKLDSPNSKSPILSSKQMLNSNYQILNSPSIRSGFTAVDWGGIIGNGSCGVGETVQ